MMLLIVMYLVPLHFFLQLGRSIHILQVSLPALLQMSIIRFRSCSSVSNIGDHEYHFEPTLIAPRMINITGDVDEILKR